MSLNTRRFKRVGLTGEVLIAHHETEISLEGASISEGGMSLVSPDFQFKPGQIVDVSIDDGVIPAGIKAKGEVVNYLYRNGNNLFVKFLDISTNDIENIRRYINSSQDTQILNISFDDLI